ncbi:hypothetical protein [Pantoea agglomerans]|uniref:hypothetical protein n=1 Tax=Enterobacter agglomerans TaxID=549 RepID=UPI003DA1C649
MLILVYAHWPDQALVCWIAITLKIKKVVVMDLATFETRTGLWPHMQFTDVEYDLCSSGVEIYAIDVSRQTKSKLFICRVTSEQQAAALTAQFKEWLPKLKLKKRKVALNLARMACDKSYPVNPKFQDRSDMRRNTSRL